MTPIPDWLVGRHLHSYPPVWHIAREYYDHSLGGNCMGPLEQHWDKIPEHIKKPLIAASLITGVERSFEFDEYVMVHPHGELAFYIDGRALL